MPIDPRDLPTSIHVTLANGKVTDLLLSGTNGTIAAYGSHSAGIQVDIPLNEGVYDKSTSEPAAHPFGGPLNEHITDLRVDNPKLYAKVEAWFHNLANTEGVLASEYSYQVAKAAIYFRLDRAIIKPYIDEYIRRGALGL